jgi:hypothetical protein
MSETLEPGDLVRLVVMRDGRPREITVEAASPPAQVVISPNTEQMVIELEALSGNILKSMDSLRVSLGGLKVGEEDGNLSFQILRIPSDSSMAEGQVRFDFKVQQPFDEPLVFGSEPFYMAPDVALPFEAMVVESQATAPLKEELAQLRKELTAIRRDELARRRELAAAIQGPIEEVLQQDDRMRELQAQEAQLLVRQEQLADHLREVSEAELQRHWVEVQSRSEEAFFRAQRSRESQRALEEAVSRARREEVERTEEAEQLRTQSQFLYRSPVIVGQSFFLGAQIAPLNPQLAEYFPVDEGVFVVQVVEGSPAAKAGLQGGDIIVNVAGEDVNSLSDLRFSLSAFEGPIQIRVIRKGDPVQIVIRR